MDHGSCRPAAVPSTRLHSQVRSVRVPKRSAADHLAALPSFALFSLLFLAVSLAHATLLRLPYYWDEAGYYIPAALDFYHRGTLIPEFTNAHPPLPNILLGSLWHITGFHILPTRLLVCAVAAGALLAVFRLAKDLLDAAAACAVCLLTGVYSIWYVQSSLAHADIFAALFTLWGLVCYFRLLRGEGTTPVVGSGLPESLSRVPAERRSLLAIAALFSLAALAKETAIVQPAALAVFELARWWRGRAQSASSSVARGRRILALSFPLLPLVAWFAYHRVRTGFVFGNPEYLRYNATANLTAGHILTALRFRFVHLAWQRDIWIPLTLAAVCLALLRQERKPLTCGLSGTTWAAFGVLIVANWIAFSFLGGALLTRYLLPVYPLLLLLCVAVWRAATPLWVVGAGVTAVAFLAGWWLSPPTAFAPEDNLTYRDMIVVHQEAIEFVRRRYPDATVLTAWPVAMDLLRPELGYIDRPMRVTSLENFTREQVLKAAQEPATYDTAILFPTHFVSPTLQQYFATHPSSARARSYFAGRDLSAKEAAGLLGGKVVWQADRNGEWAAVLRFPRSYEARNVPMRDSSLRLP